MIKSTKKELKEAIRLGIRPCSFCKFKRTENCEKIPPNIVLKNVPNLKQKYNINCPPETIKSNLNKIIDCYFSKDNSGLSSIFTISKNEYTKVVLNHIRPCSICSACSEENCTYCTSEEVKLDLLLIIDEFFNTKEWKI